METPPSHDARALPHEAPAVTEYDYDNLTRIDSDAYEDTFGIDSDTNDDDDTFDRPTSFPTQTRFSKKVKGDRFDPSLDRKGPLNHCRQTSRTGDEQEEAVQES